ncbi:MAG TPA: ZIP family metal transporter [Candidatus Limnocylindrales bacterium]
MEFGQTVILGAIAGCTIFLGLPFGRLTTMAKRTRIFLGGVSAGILVFLFFDILEHATEPLEDALTAKAWDQVAGLGAAYVVGLGLGLLGLIYLPRLLRPRPTAPSGVGPGAMAVAEADANLARTEALGIGMTIAMGIGLHNFSEGLAIGQSASAGAISLAVLLIIGFGLHNATEGFGIVGPLVARGVRPTWTWLLAAGLIGGGPTFLGTVVGTAIDSQLLFVGCLALAAGAILNVVGELFVAGRRMSWELTLGGMFVGFLAGLATDMILVAAGA